MKLGLYSWVVIERPHTNGDLLPMRPVTAEKTGTAHATKGLHRPLAFSIDTDQRIALKEGELLPPYTCLRTNGCAGMLATPRTVAMIGSNEGWAHLEAHSAAEATTANDVVQE